MPFVPKKLTNRKHNKQKISKKAVSENFGRGTVAVIARESARLTPRQVKSARRTIKRTIKPLKGKVKTKIRAYLNVTFKAAKSRMGRGKSRVALTVARVRKGSILFVIHCIDWEVAVEAAKQCSFRLPIDVSIVRRLRIPVIPKF